MSRARCHPDRRLHGRGLCSTCHSRHDRAGTLHTQPRRRDVVLDTYAAGRAAGLLNKQIARRLGLTLSGLESLLADARKTGDPRAGGRREVAA